MQVTDLLPSGLTYIGSSTRQGTYDNTTGLWNVGSLKASAIATLTLSASVNTGTAGTTIENWAYITHADQTDPVDINNSDHDDGITVHAAPAAYSASNSPVCEGTTICLFGGPGGMTSYHWTGPGGFTSDEENPVMPNATSAMAGTYTLTVTNSNGCTDSDNVVLALTYENGQSGPPAPPLTVGRETYPTNKLAVLAPWIVLLAAILAGTSLLVVRRNRARG